MLGTLSLDQKRCIMDVGSIDLKALDVLAAKVEQKLKAREEKNKKRAGAKRKETLKTLNRKLNSDEGRKEFNLEEQKRAVATVKVLKKIKCSCGYEYEYVHAKLVQYEYKQSTLTVKPYKGFNKADFPRYTVFQHITEEVEGCEKCSYH